MTGARKKTAAGEAEFLASYDPTRFDPVAVTVDLALLTILDGRLSILLIERGGHPYKGAWALPGGFVNRDEDLDTAARRELVEETNVTVDVAHVEQLRTYGTPDRDPRMRVVSVAYLCFMPMTETRPVAGDDAATVRWWAIDDLFAEDGPDLAFDHTQVIQDAVERCRSKIEYTTLATSFLGATFTLGELRRVYETVWDLKLDPGNFGRKVRSIEGFVIADGPTSGRGHRPLYRSGPASEIMPPFKRPNPEGSPA